MGWFFNKKPSSDVIITKSSKDAIKEFNEEEQRRKLSKICPECNRVTTKLFAIEDDKYVYRKCSYSDCRCEWKARI